MTKVNVLHLSDLHFGVESLQVHSATALAQRKNTLDGLINKLKDIDSKWKPHIVAISGDIGWSGCDEDYVKAGKWVEEELLKNLGLNVNDLVVCAGNHDIDLKKTKYNVLPLTSEDADDCLSIENLEHFPGPFDSYKNKFCQDVKIPQLSIDNKKNNLIGQRVLKDLRFVVLNSAWFCRGDGDRGRLWIGQPQLKVMESASQLVNPEKYDSEKITIAILHHPPGYLNEEETGSYRNRINTFRHLSERCHIILAGHDHGAIEEPDRKYDSAYLFKGGASYSGDDYRNNFSIYQIDKAKRTLERQLYEFDPRYAQWTSKDGNVKSLKKPETAISVTTKQVFDTGPFDDEIKFYCQQAETMHAKLPVAGFVTQLKVPIKIAEIYVPMRAMVNLTGEDAIFADALHAEKKMAERDACVEIHLPDAFKEAEKRKRKGLVILGDPGSGKTTHLKRLLLTCLRNGAEKLNLPTDMIPVFLPLRELRDLDHGLDRFIEEQLADPHLETPEGFGKRLLQRGNLLFLLDGLDEVSDLKLREKVAGWILKAISAHPACCFVVTCRFAGYSPTVHMSEDFLEMHVRPFNSDEVGRFVNNWYKAVEQGLAIDVKQAGKIATEKADRLIKRLKEPDFRTSKVFELTRNPLLLTNICLIHRHRDDLPAKRYKLYEECIDVLVEHWRRPKNLNVAVPAWEGSRILQPVALWMHGKEGRTRAKASELVPQIDPVLKSVGWARGTADEFLRTIRDESGLLTGWDQEHFGFMHLSFQEYLAAREIRNRVFKDKNRDLLIELASHFGESWWQEVILLMLALEDPSLFDDFMLEVVRLPAFATNSALVDMCLKDAAEISVKPFVDLLNKEPGNDKELWDRQTAALRVIMRLDKHVVEKIKTRLEKHPSPDIRRVFKDYKRIDKTGREIINVKQIGYELVRIPGGSFLMGSPESERGYDNEGPQHNVVVPEFYMGRFPVTNRQYEIFLVENPGVKEPSYWDHRKFNQPEQPVIGVSWNEAKEYAEWAGLRLPTEAEWEYACRAGTTTLCYTGDERKDYEKAGWYFNNSKDSTHPVGEKEANMFGLYDMHGNVNEWVEDDWHYNYNGAPYNGSAWIDGNNGGSDRVIRGGGWNSYAHGYGSAVRDYRKPDDRYNINVGFRLSRSDALGS